MLELEQALERILGCVPAPLAERVGLEEAHGRTLAQTVESPIDLPVFDNSAMDGYAVRSEDVKAATAEAPVVLRSVGRVAAGEAFGGEVRAGECVRLFTGSPLPRGTDAVVMQEDARVEPGDPARILILEPARPWEHIRLRGEDIARGSVIAEQGEIVTAGRLCLLAGTGLTHMEVARRPLVALLATGSELKAPGEPLAPGQIYESNRIGLASLIRGAGALPNAYPLVADRLEATRLALAGAFEECDAVISSGGVSVGEMDFLKQAFKAMGGNLEFWKVAIKPGRPFVFGRHKEKLLFGLPGNPVSALVTFLLLVRPALLRWLGAKRISAPTLPGVLAEPMANPGERRHFIRVKLEADGKVYGAGLQASHALSSFAAANGLLEIAPRAALAAGTRVQVMRCE